YFRLNSSLHSEVDRSLRDRAARDFPPSALRRPGADEAGGPPRQRASLLLAARLGDPDIYVQIDDGNGQPVLRSDNLNGGTLPLPKRADHSGFETVSVNQAPFRVLAQSLPQDVSRFFQGSNGPYTALLARSLADTDNAL